MVLGTLDALRRYPVKSLPGEPLESVEIEPDGIPGDRARALFVNAGHVRVGKAYRGKEDERLGLLDGVEVALRAAAERGVELEVRADGHFFDDAPVSLLVDRWLCELDAHVGYLVEWQRFRPNLFVRAADGFIQTELELIDAELTVGGVRLRVRSPIERCVTVTYHPQGEAGDPRILRFLAQSRNALMGVYCDVLEPGVACVGDELVLV